MGSTMAYLTTIFVALSLVNTHVYNHTSNRIKPGVNFPPYPITIGNQLPLLEGGEVVTSIPSGGGSLPGDFSKHLEATLQRTQPLSLESRIFIIPKRSQSQNCQGGVFCWFFSKKMGCSTHQKNLKVKAKEMCQMAGYRLMIYDLLLMEEILLSGC